MLLYTQQPKLTIVILTHRVRPQENQFLVVPPSEVPALSPAMQALIGYAIHPPFIGHANGRHPLKALSQLASLQHTTATSKL